LGDDLPVVLAQAVQGRPALHGHAGRRHLGELDGVVLARADGHGQVAADLLGVHVERGDHLEVADVVRPEPDLHETGNPGSVVGVLVVLQPLHEGAGAVAHAHDGDAHLTHQDDSFSEMLSSPPDCPASRSDAISSFSHRTSRSTDSRPCRCSSRVYRSTRSLVRVKAARMASIRSSSLLRRPSRIRSLTSARVCPTNAKRTPNPSSSPPARPGAGGPRSLGRRRAAGPPSVTGGPAVPAPSRPALAAPARPAPP